MGKIKYILIGFLSLIMVSCDGLFGVENNVGKPIKFGIAQHTTTRTAYSPSYDGRIDWVNRDKVAIYMDWDETRSGYGYAGYPREEKGIYEVYNIHENGKESHGRIRSVDGVKLKWQGNFEGNNGRANEFLHTFWSVYPSNTPFVDGEFKFYLPSNQSINDVSGLGLAAYEKDITSATYPNSEGFVELHYYPMFTTLCVTIDNKANFPIGSSLELYSNDYTIAGDYNVDISNFYEGIGGGSINNVSSIFKNGVATFFIIPRKYEKDKLYFSLGDKTMSIPETLYPGYKYNITLTTKEVKVEGVPEAVAQMILIFLRGQKDGNKCYSLFEKFFKQYYGYNDVNSFNNSKDFNGEGWWNHFLNKHWADANNTGKWSDALTNLFSENTIKEGALQAFLNELQSITELDLNDGDSKLTCTYDKETNLSKYFPNLETLNINVESTIDIYLTDFKKLTTVIVNGNNGNVNIHITGNGQNVTVTRGGGNTTYKINGEELSKDAGATKIVNAQPQTQ